MVSDNAVTRRVSVTLSGLYFELLDSLIREGIYVDKSEAIKDALRLLFRHYGMAPFARPLDETESQNEPSENNREKH